MIYNKRFYIRLISEDISLTKGACYLHKIQLGVYMVSNKKHITYCALIFIIFIIFIVVYVEKDSQHITSLKTVQQVTGDTGVISTMKLKSIKRHGVVSVEGNSPAALVWVPKIQKNTLNEIMFWLNEATIYKGKIPKSQNVALFKANVGPSILHIYFSEKDNISIQPAFYLGSNNALDIQYIIDVLQLNNDGQKSYIKSEKLFHWLKDDKWKTEFEMKH